MTFGQPLNRQTLPDFSINFCLGVSIADASTDFLAVTDTSGEPRALVVSP